MADQCKNLQESFLFYYFILEVELDPGNPGLMVNVSEHLTTNIN